MPILRYFPCKKAADNRSQPNHPVNPQEVAQNKKKARDNRHRFQDNRDKYLEEMRQAFKLMQLK